MMFILGIVLYYKYLMSSQAPVPSGKIVTNCLRIDTYEQLIELDGSAPSYFVCQQLLVCDLFLDVFILSSSFSVFLDSLIIEFNEIDLLEERFSLAVWRHSQLVDIVQVENLLLMMNNSRVNDALSTTAFLMGTNFFTNEAFKYKEAYIVTPEGELYIVTNENF